MSDAEDGASGGQKKNRPRAPVLDLTAQEVKSLEAAPNEAISADAREQEVPAGEQTEFASSAATANEAEQPVDPIIGTPVQGDPETETNPATSQPLPVREEPARRRRGVFPALLSGAVAGGAVAAALASLLPQRPAIPPPQSDRPEIVSRLQALEAQATQAAARPAPTLEPRLDEIAARARAGDDALLAVRALEQRIGELEAKVANLPATTPAPPATVTPQPSDDAAVQALAARISPLEAADRTSEAELKTLQTTIAELRTQAQQALQAAGAAQSGAQKAVADVGTVVAVATGELQKVAQRMQALEAALPQIQAKLAAATAPDNDREARLAAVAQSLRLSVERGEPFAAELAAATALSADAALTAALQPFAASGVPSNAALARELDALGAAPREPASESKSTGVIDRLQASASKLVRVQRTDEPAAGASPPASGDAFGTMRAAARRGDLPAALEAAKTLQPQQAAVLQPWLQKVQARLAALDAARKLTQQSLQRLSAGKAPQ
jgi:hypothetical protein